MIVTKLSGIVGGTLITALWNRAFYKKKKNWMSRFIFVCLLLFVNKWTDRTVIVCLFTPQPLPIFCFHLDSFFALSHTQNPIKTVLRPHSQFIRITWLLNGVVCVRRELLFLLSCGYVMCQSASNAVRWQCKGKQIFVPLNEKKEKKKTERKYDRTSNSNGK